MLVKIRCSNGDMIAVNPALITDITVWDTAVCQITLLNTSTLGVKGTLNEVVAKLNDCCIKKLNTAKLN
jgi:uncharacterized protein YlzI (FlbEa/FlbD family)